MATDREPRAGLDDLDKPFPSERGVCDVCEKEPILPGDCMCVDCRAWVTANSFDVVDPIETILSRHRVMPWSDLDTTECSCGAKWNGGCGYWRQHVATLVHEHFGSTYEPWVPVQSDPTASGQPEPTTDGPVGPDCPRVEPQE